ncbi:probable G-protein coupled receptor 149 [Pristis pectinata]|uniref:probable G-protein coupled receptor 149 n=1 Tax=Pristis pectinata TaxID=685728 RepID=UPI00223D0B8D|nr:probable G-protein coupled receptor 149 [Pristis pectinata]
MSDSPVTWSTNRTHSVSGDAGMPGPTASTPPLGRPVNLFVFWFTLLSSILILLGSVYSLVCLLRTRNRNSLVVIVASLSADDLLYVVAVTIFMSLQWASEVVLTSVCSAAAVLYLLHGVSSALKSSLIVIYNYYTTSRSGLCRGSRTCIPMSWLLVIFWGFSLLVCLLPVWGWGSFVPTPWGCLADHRSSYVTFLFGLYSLCFVVLIGFSVPLAYKLLCSDWQHHGPLSPNYHQVTDGATPASKVSVLEDPEDRTLRTGINQSNDIHSGSETPHLPQCLSGDFGSMNRAVAFAQKRFALILAITKIVLWLPLMIQLLVNHITKPEKVSFESLGFILTLLAAAITPLFVLSERWIHLPCGCIINCRNSVYTVASESAKGKRKGFEFNLSLQQGYGIYKISQASNCTGRESKSLSYQNLTAHQTDGCKFLPAGTEGIPSDTPIEISTTAPLDSSPRALPVQGADPRKVSDQDTGKSLASSTDGAEGKLAQEEGRKPELVDWEWCRSKSERTPRQRPSALSIPVCAFQGMVSLHAPSTGKTLSLSTYEISGEGRKITPVAKKVEVYRSKSVGHEPSSEDSPGNLANTNVKIQLEVLEICENEEALDTVSIVSNISQSSAHARSPSLRYSRRENRFISVDLAESASYSLLIPTNRSGSDISISIPDTVEAHRQNSHRQHQDRSGYQEEIQLLNEAYRKREETSKKC